MVHTSQLLEQWSIRSGATRGPALAEVCFLPLPLFRGAAKVNVSQPSVVWIIIVLCCCSLNTEKRRNSTNPCPVFSQLCLTLVVLFFTKGCIWWIFVLQSNGTFIVNVNHYRNYVLCISFFFYTAVFFVCLFFVLFFCLRKGTVVLSVPGKKRRITHFHEAEGLLLSHLLTLSF